MFELKRPAAVADVGEGYKVVVEVEVELGREVSEGVGLCGGDCAGQQHPLERYPVL